MPIATGTEIGRAMANRMKQEGIVRAGRIPHPVGDPTQDHEHELAWRKRVLQVSRDALATPLEKQTMDEKLSPERIAAAAEAMALQARPLQLADYTHSYRKQMIAVYAGKLLNQLVSMRRL